VKTRNDEIRVERSDVSLPLAGALFGGLAASIALSIVVIALVYPGALHGPSDAPRSVTAAPRLQIDPAADLAWFRAAEERELGGYGWVDRQHGTVRIPIEKAMQDVAAAGIKDWPK